MVNKVKKIIYNTSNLSDIDMHNIVKRAKALIVNSNDEIVLVYSHSNYFFLGGHVDTDETDYDCIKREIKEEAGIDVEIEKKIPFLSIIYYCKDYPIKEINTKYINNYYDYNMDIVSNLSKMSLTDEEKDGLFELRYIQSDNVLKVLNQSINDCSNINVVQDTINALEEYLKSK